MFCKNCGASLNEDVKFCPECGTPVTVAEPEEPKPSPIFAEPEPKAPMYTPPAPDYSYAQPAYAQAVPYMEDPSPILTWGIVGLVCSFLINILGIIFSAIALTKAKNYAERYGSLPDQARTGRGLAITGLIIGILSVLVFILAIIFSVAVIYAAAPYIN